MLENPQYLNKSPITGQALYITDASRNYAAFSTGGSYGVGDFSDGKAINQHAGDDGTTTRVAAVRAETAPLFIGYTNRPNGEAGGDDGRTIASFEGYRLNNNVNYDWMGAVRVISQGGSVGKYGGRLAFFTRRRDGDNTNYWKERLSIEDTGVVHFTGAGIDIAGSGNRSGAAEETTVVTLSGRSSLLELVTSATDANDLLVGEIDYISNLQSAGDKRVVRHRIKTLGTTANNRGGIETIQVKADGGSLTDVAEFTSNGLRVVTKFACNGATPQAALPAAPAAYDLATAITLANNIRDALRANGILL